MLQWRHLRSLITGRRHLQGFRFSIQDMGLSSRQVQLLLSALNGIAIPPSFMPTTDWVCNEVFAGQQESHADIAEMGRDLSTDESNPEVPFEYQDLVEKLKSLPDWQSAALYFYSCGFFEGQEWQR